MSIPVDIAIVQYSPAWLNKTTNLHDIGQLLNNISADIIVLPELCITGYSFLAKEEAFSAADKAATVAAFFQPFADASQAVIIAGFAEKEGNETYNSAIAVLPGQPHIVYRKTHLFYKEKNCFQPGNTGFLTVQHPVKDCRIGIMVCYDWRFPESARSLALQGADIICCPANLVTDVWQIGMKARALENNVYVAVANRSGVEERILPDKTIQQLKFTGHSALYDINGSELNSVAIEETITIQSRIDIARSRNKHFNEWNDIMKDRRPSMYNDLTNKTNPDLYK